MTENRKTPKLRFKGFTDAWEQRKLSEVLSSYTDPVEIPRTGYERLGIRSHAKGTFHNFVPAGHELQTAQMHRVAADKFIVNITFGWEHAVAVTDENDAGKLVSHRFPQFSLSEELDPKFLKFIILDEDFRHHLWLASPGGAGRNRVLNINEMLQYEIMIPNVPEQRKIARMLIDLDNLITLHQRKLDRLKNIKKSMLDKMFPKDGEVVPEIRFKGFTDAWEQRKLGEFGKVTSGTSIESEFTETGKYKVISIGSYSETSKYTDQGIRATKTEKIEKRILNKNDLTMILNDKTASGNIIGRVLLIDADDTYVYNQRTERIEVYEKEYLPEFLYQLLNADNIRSKIIRASQGNTQIYVNWSSISELIYEIPVSKEEQAEIAEFFTNLDNLITLHQRKLDKLKNIKKSMLDNMFV